MTIYNFCSKCGQPLDKSGKFPYCPTCDITYYRNAKPCAGIFPLKDGKVLLAKRGVEPYKGQFDTIGGFLNENELPTDGAVREALEETGLTVEVTDQLGVYLDRYGDDGDYTLCTFFIGRILDGIMEAQDDVAALEWRSLDDLPWDEGFPSNQRALRDLQQWYQNHSS